VHGFIWAHGSLKGHDSLFGRIGPRRGATHPNDVTIRTSDVWSPYKITRAHNLEDNTEETRSTQRFCDIFGQGGEGSLKGPICSMWDDLCCLEVILWIELGRTSLG
jgi:hypothetical protein